MANQLDVAMWEVVRVRTYPDDRRFLVKNRCGRFQTTIALLVTTMKYGSRKGVRYRRLSGTRRTPELRHFAALKTTSKGVIEHIDFCICIAWWVVVVGKIAKCFRC